MKTYAGTQNAYRCISKKKQLWSRMNETTVIRYELSVLFVYGPCNEAVWSSAYILPSGRIVSEWLIGKDVEGNSRGLILGSIPAVACKDRVHNNNEEEENNNNAVRIVGKPGEISTGPLLNTSQFESPCVLFRGVSRINLRWKYRELPPLIYRSPRNKCRKLESDYRGPKHWKCSI